MASQTIPLVSVIILNWNGKKFLQTCISSLLKQQYKNIEIIVIDQNSSDGSVIYLQTKFPAVKVIASRVNNGFAHGNNMGAEVAKGKYLLFLNNDTKVTDNFLSPLVKILESNSKIGCLQPEMRIMAHPDLLDEAGAYLTLSGFLYHYGYRKSHGMDHFKHPRTIFSAKGACMLIPKKAFTQVGKLDDDFFIFFEETDLCHRLWLAGYQVVYIPKTHIYHVAGGDTVDTYNYEQRVYLTFKNMNCCYLKNFGPLYLLTIFPIFLLFQFGVLLYFLTSGKWGVVRSIVNGWWWNIVNLKSTFSKRFSVQNKVRKVTDSEIRSHIYYNPGIYYYYCLLFDAKAYRHNRLYQYEVNV